MPRIFLSLMAILLIFVVSACGQAHEHGPNSHTHDEAVAPDTAGTYVDSTSVFFGEDDHEHGADTHEHDDE